MNTSWERAAEFHVELNPNKIRALKSLDNINVLRCGAMEYWNDGILVKAQQSNIPTFHCSSSPILNPVKLPRIIVENFLSQLRRNIFPHRDRIDKLVFSGWIAVRIVRADEQMIRPGVPGDVRNILVRFASDVEPVLAKQISARAMLPFFFQQPPQDMYQKRRPTGRRFDEAEAQSGKLFRYSIRHDIAKSQQRHHSRMPEGVIARDIEHFEYRFHAAAGVNADR